MNTKNITKVLLLVAITILLVGLVSAATVNKTSTTKDTKIVKDNSKSSLKTATKTIKEPAKKVTNNTITKKEITKKPLNQTKKTTGTKTYEVYDYETLDNIISSNSYDKITINIKSDLNIQYTIKISEKIKSLTINGNGKTIDGHYNQFLKNYQENTVTINNIKINHCSASYGGAIYNEKGKLNLINCTLNNNGVDWEGGAIYNNGGTLTISNSILNNNKATEAGGAIYNNYGNLTIINSLLSNNQANEGGAIYNGGNLNINNCTLNNNKATAASGQYEGGGAIYNYRNSIIKNSIFNGNIAKDNSHDIYNHFDKLKIIQCSFSNKNTKRIKNIGTTYYDENSNIKNIIDNKGQISYFNKLNKNEKNFTYLNQLIHNGQKNIKLNYDIKLDVFNDEEFKIPYGIKLNVNNLIINGKGHKINAQGINRIFDIYATTKINNIQLERGYSENGGAIYNNAGTLTISNSILNNNQAEEGGAIYNKEGKLTIKHSTLNNNKATGKSTWDGGGAIKNFYGDNITIENNNFKNNKADGDGGAIYSFYGDNILIKNNNFLNNSATRGAAIYSEAKITRTTREVISNPGVWVDGYYLMDGNIYKYGPDGRPIYIEGHYANRTYITITDTSVKGGNINIMDNKFTKNKATTSSKAIKVTEDENITIENNAGETTSKSSSTIYLDTINVKIKNNLFDTTKKPTKIVIKLNNTKPYIGNKVKTTITLKDTNGKPIKYQKVTLKIGSKTYSIKTNSKGITTNTYKTNKKGTIKVTASFKGTTAYKKSTKTIKMKVLPKIKTKLTLKLSKTKAKVKDKIKITATLKNKSNKAIKNQKVAIKIGSKTYNKKTNKKGVISFTYKVVKSALNKAVKATYKGNYMYLNSKASKKLLKA